MQNEIEMLRSIRQSTEMGCSGIRAVLPEAQNPAMQSALRSQWKEYDSIYAEADRLLRERGVRLSGVNPLAKYGSMLTAKLRVRGRPEHDGENRRDARAGQYAWHGQEYAESARHGRGRTRRSRPCPRGCCRRSRPVSRK